MTTPSPTPSLEETTKAILSFLGKKINDIALITGFGSDIGYTVQTGSTIKWNWKVWLDVQYSSEHGVDTYRYTIHPEGDTYEVTGPTGSKKNVYGASNAVEAVAHFG